MTDRLGPLSLFPPAKRFTYMDAASVGLQHKGSAKAITDWQNALANEGTVAFDEQAELDCLNNLNNAASQLFNAETTDIAIASSETVLMSSLAWAVNPQGHTNIVATDITHPSTVYPWVRLSQQNGAEMRWVQSNNYYIDPREFEAAIDDNTSVVCVSHVEYGTGQCHDLKRLARVAHSHGALCIVDATQSAGQLPIDVVETGVDAVATSSYKWLCGPFGTGFMYVSKELQKLNPGIVGWRSHKDMWDFDACRLEYADTAKRYEFGTMAYGTALGVTESLNYLLSIGIQKIADHNRCIADQLINGLTELGAEILSPHLACERSATVAVRFPGKNSQDFAKDLKRNSIIASLRSDFIRFSPHLYNNTADINQALAAIKEAY